jgi:hypothetical protein
MFGAWGCRHWIPLCVALRDPEVGIPFLPHRLLMAEPLSGRHTAVPRQGLQARMAQEGPLDKGAEGVPCHLRGAGVEALKVVIETVAQGMCQRARLPLKGKPQAVPLQTRPKVGQGLPLQSPEL